MNHASTGISGTIFLMSLADVAFLQVNTKMANGLAPPVDIGGSRRMKSEFKKTPTTNPRGHAQGRPGSSFVETP